MNVILGGTERVHRLVGKTFIPNPRNKPEIDHIDTIKINNHPLNLQWVTAKEHRRLSGKRGQIGKRKTHKAM